MTESKIADVVYRIFFGVLRCSVPPFQVQRSFPGQSWRDTWEAAPGTDLSRRKIEASMPRACPCSRESQMLRHGGYEAHLSIHSAPAAQNIRFRGASAKLEIAL